MSKVWKHNPYTTLLLRYANGRQLCNCNEAYEGLVDCWIGGVKSKRPGCVYGCDANMFFARNEIAKRVVEEFLR